MFTIEERNALILEHVPFIKMIANRYKSKGEFDDLVQQGVLGLIRATEKFDPTRDIKFLTYASYWITGFISRQVEKDRQMITVDDLEKLDLSFTIEEDLLLEDLKEKTRDKLEEATSNKRDLDIVLARYYGDETVTLQELGDKYGVSRQRMEQIEKRILAKLKAKLLEGDKND